MTVRQVQAKVNEAVPLGASRDQVESWLKSQGISYWYYPSAEGLSDPYVHDEYIRTGELNPDDLGGCVVGRILDTKSDFLITWDIKLTFVLDKNSRTIRRWIYYTDWRRAVSSSDLPEPG